MAGRCRRINLEDVLSLTSSKVIGHQSPSIKSMLENGGVFKNRMTERNGQNTIYILPRQLIYQILLQKTRKLKPYTSIYIIHFVSCFV